MASLELKIKHEREADHAIAQYDAAVFACVGHPITEAVSDNLAVLAFYACEACKRVEADKHNAPTVAYYREHRLSIHAIELTE